MLKKITLGLTCLMINWVTAQTTNCDINPLVLQYYSEDIRSLANEYMWQTQQDTTAIQIPQQHFDFVASRISAVLELNTAETDSIFNQYCVHDVRDINDLKQFIVFIDETQPWTAAWMDMQQTTGNPIIDNFMTTNNFQLLSYVQLPYDTSYGRHYVTISSPIVVNSRGVINWFEAQIGILNADQNYAFGGAGKLSIYKEDGLSYLAFATEWSDCGDGCDNLINWTYTVSDTDCEVDYLGSFEFHVWDSWPDAPEANCNTFLNVASVSDSKMTLYPNPAETHATIILPEILLGETLKVVNTLGQIIKTILVNNTTITIDLSTMPIGIYYLSTDKSTQAVKLIKH